MRVRRNPRLVWTVSIVPTREGSDSSAMLAENWAESATTVIPHTIQSPVKNTGLRPNSNPTNIEQVPLRTIAVMAMVVRPHRSASQPAITQPSPPLRSEEHTSELQSHSDLVCRLLLEKKKQNK